MSVSLYEQLGGRDTVELVVAAFYERVLADPTLKDYFRGVSMARLHAHQVDFFCTALGGPASYRGRDMREAHAGMRITGDAFDAVAGHLKDALAALGAPAAAIDQVLGLVGPLRAEIVTD